MKAHPAADIFPLLQGDEFASLCESVKENGLIQPIVTHDGLVLDGRNRLRACEETGVDPLFKEWSGECGDPVTYSLTTNAKRRHLTPSQLAMVATDALPLYEEQAAKRKAESNRRRTQEREIAPLDMSDAWSADHQRKSAKKQRAADDAAAAVGASPRYVQEAKAIAKSDPTLAAEVRSGAKTIPQAKREIKERKREAKRGENRAALEKTKGTTKAPTATFATIVADPPWHWGDMGDFDQYGRSRPTYETMPIGDLESLSPWGKAVSEHADDDAHLYLWVTNRSLQLAFRLVEPWGFRFVTLLTWCKPSFGMGTYFRGQTEHVLFCVRGSQSLKRKNAGTVFHAKRGKGGHSSKPDEFFDLVESCSPGPYLNLFSRRERKGWTPWGESSC